MKLTRRQRTVYVLAVLHEYPQRDVAAELGLSESRVSELVAIVTDKYADARSICPDVPEDQFRRAFIGSN